MKNIVFAFLLLLSTYANAIVTQLELFSAISCNTKVENQYFITELTKQNGAPRFEQGAAWFKGTGTMYGSAVKEIFVSTTPTITFLGVVLETPPDSVIPNIQNSKQYPTNVHVNGDSWSGADGRSIMWHSKKYTKIFCLGGR